MYRISWREWKSHLKTPVAGKVEFEDGHDRLSAIGKANDLLNSGKACWVFISDQSLDFTGKDTRG